MELAPYTIEGTTGPLIATPEQAAIIEAGKSMDASLMINALAGAAKTSTLQFLAKYMPAQPTLCLAFNKRIADEMTKRLPGHVKCQTLNSLGHGIWRRVTTKGITLDKDKLYRLLSGQIENFGRRDKGEAYDFFADILRVAKLARINGYIPNGVFPHATRLIPVDDFWETIRDDQAEDSPIIRDLVDRVLQASIVEAYNGTIDFDDQVYMPTLFGGSYPRFPVVMVDEAQDLSPLNHEMLRKLDPDRLFAVGDPYQSIYAFRGASVGGMRSLAKDFNMVQLTLSVSFRCPKSVVLRARDRVPHMQWADFAQEGSVTELDKWGASSVPDGAAILCRNNAPLIKLAFQLIRAGRGVELRGFDIGSGLIRVLKHLAPEGQNLHTEEAHRAINRWEAERLAKAKAQATTRDRAECLRVFVDIGGSLKGAILHAEAIFKARGPIQLLSGHKSKGLEWDTVFHLDPWRIPSPFAAGDEGREQELNVRYVIETRARRTLVIVNAKDFSPNAE